MISSENALLKSSEIHSLTHSFNRYILSTYYVPGTVLVVGMQKQKNRQIPLPRGSYIFDEDEGWSLDSVTGWTSVGDLGENSLSGALG